LSRRFVAENAAAVRVAVTGAPPPQGVPQKAYEAALDKKSSPRLARLPSPVPRPTSTANSEASAEHTARTWSA